MTWRTGSYDCSVRSPVPVHGFQGRCSDSGLKDFGHLYWTILPPTWDANVSQSRCINARHCRCQPSAYRWKEHRRGNLTSSETSVDLPSLQISYRLLALHGWLERLCPVVNKVRWSEQSGSFPVNRVGREPVLPYLRLHNLNIWNFKLLDVRCIYYMLSLSSPICAMSSNILGNFAIIYHEFRSLDSFKFLNSKPST